jgi:hypothetical protein
MAAVYAKRPKPQRRRRVKRSRMVHRDRARPGLVFRMPITDGSRFLLEVRLAADKRRMMEAANFHEGKRILTEIDPRAAGFVRTWTSTRHPERAILMRRQTVARMYLNRRDLRNIPGDLVAHESTHAAMHWVRYKRANLAQLAGEEVLAYSVGHLTQRLSNLLPAFVFGVSY